MSIHKNSTVAGAPSSLGYVGSMAQLRMSKSLVSVSEAERPTPVTGSSDQSSSVVIERPSFSLTPPFISLPFSCTSPYFSFNNVQFSFAPSPYEGRPLSPQSPLAARMAGLVGAAKSSTPTSAGYLDASQDAPDVREDSDGEAMEIDDGGDDDDQMTDECVLGEPGSELAAHQQENFRDNTGEGFAWYKKSGVIAKPRSMARRNERPSRPIRVARYIEGRTMSSSHKKAFLKTRPRGRVLAECAAELHAPTRHSSESTSSVHIRKCLSRPALKHVLRRHQDMRSWVEYLCAEPHAYSLVSSKSLDHSRAARILKLFESLVLSAMHSAGLTDAPPPLVFEMYLIKVLRVNSLESAFDELLRHHHSVIEDARMLFSEGAPGLLPIGETVVPLWKYRRLYEVLGTGKSAVDNFVDSLCETRNSSRRLLASLRMLLIIAGVEPNPGPIELESLQAGLVKAVTQDKEVDLDTVEEILKSCIHAPVDLDKMDLKELIPLFGPDMVDDIQAIRDISRRLLAKNQPQNGQSETKLAPLPNTRLKLIGHGSNTDESSHAKPDAPKTDLSLTGVKQVETQPAPRRKLRITRQNSSPGDLPGPKEDASVREAESPHSESAPAAAGPDQQPSPPAEKAPPPEPAQIDKRVETTSGSDNDSDWVWSDPFATWEIEAAAEAKPSEDSGGTETPKHDQVPDPAKAHDDDQNQTRRTTGKQRKTPQAERQPRQTKRRNMIGVSVQDSLTRAAATNDALKEKLQEEREQHAEHCQELELELNSALASVVAADKLVKLAEKNGFVSVERQVLSEFCFHGTFAENLQSTFLPKDPIVNVRVYKDDIWEFDGHTTMRQIVIPPEAVTVALSCAACEDPQQRFRNIHAGLVQSKELREARKTMSYNDRMAELFTLELQAFLLCGSYSAGGKVRWLNDCAEWVPHRYTCELPSDWEARLKGVILATDTMKLQGSWARNARRAPYYVKGLCPHMPDASDWKTLVAGMCKRLFPDLDRRTERMRRKLNSRAADLANLIQTRTQGQQAPGFDDALRNFLEGRPRAECEGIMQGVEMWRKDYVQAINHYLDQPYKCFIKLETYPNGTFKPPRFIMSLELPCRGIQFCAMHNILWKIETGTEQCNVKHLTSDQITEKLKAKFAHLDLVAETDFSSFESCIDPDMKALVENHIFQALAETQAEQEFISRALARKEVLVIGPSFTIPRFHHIRMSGDYWTSLGNLITNVVIISVCSCMPIDELVRRGLFEGDDGTFPAPRDPAKVCLRASRCGVKLTFDIAPWHALSFCGNHFELVNGNLCRHRDPLKALGNGTVLFNAPKSTLRHDRMLQRSKMLSYLDGPIIPDTFVFAAVVERFTRDARVDEKYLYRAGLLKPYNSYHVESCVPEWLVRDTFGWLDDEKFCKVVYERNLSAGGKCDLSTIREMVKVAREAGPGVVGVGLPNPIHHTEDGSWYARDGLRFTHRNTNSLLRYKQIVWNNRYDLAWESAPEKPVMTITDGAEIHRKNHLVQADRLSLCERVLPWVGILVTFGLVAATTYFLATHSMDELNWNMRVEEHQYCPLGGDQCSLAHCECVPPIPLSSPGALSWREWLFEHHLDQPTVYLEYAFDLTIEWLRDTSAALCSTSHVVVGFALALVHSVLSAVSSLLTLFLEFFIWLSYVDWFSWLVVVLSTFFLAALTLRFAWRFLRWAIPFALRLALAILILIVSFVFAAIVWVVDKALRHWIFTAVASLLFIAVRFLFF